MKIAIATACNHDGLPMAALTNPNKQEYCKTNGYTFLFQRRSEPYKHILVGRHKWYLQLLKSGEYDAILFMDADSIFTNMKKRVEDVLLPNDAMVGCKGAPHFNAGVWIGLPCERTFKCIEKLLSLQREPIPPECGQSDENTLLTLDEFHAAIRYIPQRQLQSYDYELYVDLGGNYAKGIDADGNDGRWQPGDWIFHVPGVPWIKSQVLKKHLEQVVR